MQKLQCELCGSIDILRTDDGFFQCQHCGCKYTLEQAKALIGSVETTIGDAELNRRVENAKAQIRIGQPAEETIESILKDFPASPKGYLLYFENIFETVLKNPAKCSINDNTAVSRYNSLYALAKESSEITIDEVNRFFNGYSTKIYNGSVNGELSERVILKISAIPDPVIKKTYEIGKNNAELLSKHRIKVFNRINQFNVLAYDISSSWKNPVIKFCLGKEWYDTYKIPVKPLIITEDNIGVVLEFAKKATKEIIVDKERCLLCGGLTTESFFSEDIYKCSNYDCLTKYNLKDLI